MKNQEQLIKKWQGLIDLCKKYYVDCLPTGVSDTEYDRLETLAAQDGFFVRDYVSNTYLKGIKTKNQFIDKLKKVQIDAKESTMLDAIIATESKLQEPTYNSLKYDGSSIAIYLDPLTGIPRRIVTVGNLNLDDFGVDQTWKLLNHLPPIFPKGITAIQCEALVDVTRLAESDSARARQKANGLINAKHNDPEIRNLLTLRALRYFTDDSMEGLYLRSQDFREVLYSFGNVVDHLSGHVLFAPAQLWTTQELIDSGYNTETDVTLTQDGVFLNDGWVVYTKQGICKFALKYKAAGNGPEAISTKVLGIKWNDQSGKGKDSWSANVLIEPVQIKGCTVKKPSAGSVGKMVKNNTSVGATVGIILANSTTPMVGDTFSPGNGDFQWPTCSCGYKLSEKDIFAANIKCGNLQCSSRIARMTNYLENFWTGKGEDLDLNRLLVLNGFKWETTDINIGDLLNYVVNDSYLQFYDCLNAYMTTDLRKKNLSLVAPAAWTALRYYWTTKLNG